MRATLLILCLAVLSACSADPKALGITGPGAPAAPPPPPSPLGDDGVSRPGVQTPGSYYAPNMAPVTGSSGFWNYN
jgi:hypothetical protein